MRFVKPQGMMLAMLLTTGAIVGCSQGQDSVSIDCQTLEDNVPVAAGGSLIVTAISGTIAPDDAMVVGSVVAESTVEKLPADIEEQNTLLATLQGLDTNTEELEAYQAAYIEKTEALIDVATQAQTLYGDIAAAIDGATTESEPTPEQIATLESVAADTEGFKAEVETLTGEMDEITNEIFNYCLDAEFRSE